MYTRFQIISNQTKNYIKNINYMNLKHTFFFSFLPYYLEQNYAFLQLKTLSPMILKTGLKTFKFHRDLLFIVNILSTTF